MLHFEGDRDIPQPAATLYAKLSDANFLVTCIPDVESVSQCDRATATLKLRPSFSFVRGTLDLTLRVVDEAPGSALRLHMQTRGIGTTSTVEAAMALTPAGQGTHLHWTVDVTELGGLLKAVPKALIKAAAQKIIAGAWTSLEARLADSAAK